MTQMNTLGIIDISHIVFACWFNHDRGGREMGPAECQMVLNEVIGRVKEYAANHPVNVIAFDHPPYNRTKVFPEYKAKREEKPSGLVEMLKTVRNVFNNSELWTLSVQGYEADDVIATCVQKARDAGWKSVVYTRDKDLFQLIGADCSVVSTGTGTVIGEDEVFKKMGVRPDQILDLICLMGDASDGIPGVGGVGAKGAADLLAEHDDIFGILEAAKAGELRKGNKVNAELNRKFNDLEVLERIALAGHLARLEDQLPIELDLFDEKALIVPKETVVADEHGLVETQDGWEEEGSGAELVGRRSGKMDASDTIAFAMGHIRTAQVDPNPPRAIERTAPQAEVVALSSITLRPGLELNSEQFKLLEKLATRFWNSGLYSRFGSQDAVFSCLELGLELGIPAQVCLGLFHNLKGKLSPAANFLIALAKRDPNCEYLEMVEETATSVTYETKKKHGYKEPMRFTYSQQDAINDQQSWAKGGKNFRAMLRKTAGSQASRLWYPEAVAGMYSQAELGFDEGDE
jgi:5'-3' exonuclease